MAGFLVKIAILGSVNSLTSYFSCRMKCVIVRSMAEAGLGKGVLGQVHPDSRQLVPLPRGKKPHIFCCYLGRLPSSRPALLHFSLHTGAGSSETYPVVNGSPNSHYGGRFLQYVL